MKTPHFIVLLCLVCGLFSFAQTDSSTSYNIPNEDSVDYSDSKPVTKTTVNPKRIVDEIHNSCGLFCDSEKLKKCTERINVDNAFYVVNCYKNMYGKSVFKAIMRSVFISSDTRAEAVKHINEMYMQAIKRDGIYTDDIYKLIDGHIDYAKNKFGRMNSRLIDRDLKTLSDRIKQTKWKENTIYPANGKIDAEFKQGDYLGDCWLIACIKSMSVNPQGQKMLDDIISINKNGNVTVRLKGVRKKYTISKKEIEGTNELAQGDLDVRAIEIAIRRFLIETGDHNLSEKIKNRFNGPKIRFCEYNMYHGMHDLSRLYNILFGKPLAADSRTDESTIDKIKTGRYSVVVSSNNRYSLDNNYDFIKYHSYAVIGADNKYVYLSSTGSLSKKLKITHANFIKFFNTSYAVQLSD